MQLADNLRVVFTAVLWLWAAAAAEAGEAVRLRVISYNIHHGEGVDSRLDLPRIAKVLLSEQPDLVALCRKLTTGPLGPVRSASLLNWPG